MLSTRLSPDVEARLNSFATAYGLTKSAVAEAAISDYMTRILGAAKDKVLAKQAKQEMPQALRASDRVLQSLKALSKKMPNQDFDWKAARDEGRK
jgi:predicted DNA-binding protein